MPLLIENIKMNLLKKILLINLLSLISFSVYAEDLADFHKALEATALHEITAPQKNLTILQTPTVNMLVFTTYDGYKLTDTKVGINIWTTASPDVKQLCTDYVKQHKNITHDELNIWIAKLLGLPIKNASARKFVELNIPVIQAYYGHSVRNQIGIFRPCLDPRVGPHQDHTDICPKQMDVNNKEISSEFKTWFINNSITAHTLDGSPWTEDGLTYNWNNNTDSIGVSEFVVLKNTPITVLPNPNNSTTAYISSEQYCGASS